MFIILWVYKQKPLLELEKGLTLYKKYQDNPFSSLEGL